MTSFPRKIRENPDLSRHGRACPGHLRTHRRAPDGASDARLTHANYANDATLRSDARLTAAPDERALPVIAYARRRESIARPGTCAAILTRHLALPAYDQCIDASHLFKLLGASRGISVTQRASYIGRVWNLAKACCEEWVARE